MAIPQDFLYQRYEDESRYTILTSDLTLTADLIDPTKDCVIYADALTLDEGKGKLLFPGRNLTVCCRTLNPNGVMLSTQPPDPIKGAPPPKPRTSDDPAVNKGNLNGQDADPITKADYGAAGGNITILADIIERPLTLNSSGGKGRDGQGGGDAAKGTQGASGNNDEKKTRSSGHVISPDGKYPGTPGYQGKAGGNGGNGGAPGFGGNAGAITVSTVTEPPDITSTAAGGSCGKPGSPGSGGAGGKGGLGGRIGEWKRVWHGHFSREEFVLTNSRYADGPSGPAGQDGQVINGQDGAKATVTTKIINDIQATFKADAHLFAQLQMMMQVVKIHYLGRDFQRAGRVLTWIFNLTAKRDAAENAIKWLGLHQQAATYLSRLSRGLDYFGNAANFVPTASFSLYCSTVTPMLTLGGTVQAVFDTYTKYLQDQKSGYSDFSRAFSAGSKAIETYKDAITAEIKQRNTLWDECTALEVKIVPARSRMLNAEESFKSAVIARENCKKFEVIVKLVGSLSGFPGDITALWKDVKDKSGGIRFNNSALKFAGNLPGNFLDLVKDIKVLASDWSDAGKQFDNIEHSLETDGADSVKLAADVAAIDQKLEEYMDIPEARAYREEIHNYVELCKARNMKVIQCSKLDEDVLQLNGKIDQTSAQMNELKGAESGKLDPTLAPYRSFLLGLYNNYKDSLIDKLFYETLAYRYRTLQDFSKILQSGHTIAELSVMQGQILQDVIDYENRVTSIEQPFKNLITHPMKCASTDSIAAFRKGGVLFFHIPTNEAAFQGLAQLQLTKFTVSIPGVRFQSDSKTVFVRLKCHGDCSVVDPKSSSTIFHFTHNPIEAAYKYEIIEHGNGHSEEHYLAGGALVNTEDGPGQKSISLSPFCTWSMSLPSEYNTGVDLSQVSDVILGFGGKGVPISAEYRAVWAAKWQA